MSDVHLLAGTEPLDDPLTPYLQVRRERADGGCWVLANMVGALNGSATVDGRAGGLSTAPDKAMFSAIRSLADVVLVGSGTIRQEGYGSLRLPPERAAARVAQGRPEAPRLAVVSRSLDLDWSAKAFAGAAPERRPLILTGEAADPGRLAQAREVADVVTAGPDQVDPGRAAEALTGLGYRVVLCEGGPTLLGQFVAAGRLDELCLTVSPLMGGDSLPVAVIPPGAALRHFSLRHVLRAEDTLFLRYERGADDE